jgi:trimeric autotransporter adhesin
MFTQAVTLTASGLPPGASVAFAPATVTPGANGATATMTIETAAASAANRLERLNDPSGGPLLALALCIPVSLRKRESRRIAWLGLVVVIMGLQGCGGGFALPQSQTTHPAAQTYTVTVSGASGATQHSTTVQILIQS